MLETLVNSLPVFIAIALGVFFKQKKLIGKEGLNVIATIAFKISIPFLILKVLYGQTFTIENLSLFIHPLYISALVALIGYLISRAFKVSKKQQGIIMSSMMGFSIGSFAYPFILLNFTENVFENVVLIDIVLFFLLLTVGYVIAMLHSSNKSGNIKTVLKKIFLNPIIIAMIFTLGINYAGVTLHEAVLNTADFMAKPFSFLASFMLGLTLSLPSKKTLTIISVSFISRLVIVSGILYILFYNVFSQNTIQFNAMTLSLLTPFTTVPILFAHEFDLDKELAAQLSLFSKLASIIVYPLVISFLN